MTQHAKLPPDAGEDTRELTVVVPTLNERDNIEALVARLNAALVGIAWEAVFVDDDSRDGTPEVVAAIADRQSNIRLIRRFDQRGLAGAALAGMLSSRAPYVALIDADLQHDETRLTAMLAPLRRGEADLVVGSRYSEGGATAGLSPIRRLGSQLATWLVGLLTQVRLTDPLSGFFMVRADIVASVAPRLSPQGFKVLLDLVASAPQPLRVREVAYQFRERQHGESKLGTLVVFEYLSLLCAKAMGDRVSPRFLMYGLVGASGVLVNLFVLAMLLGLGMAFTPAQSLAIAASMASNYALNNSSTYRDQRHSGWQMLTGFAQFAAICGVGLLTGVGVATFLHRREIAWWLAGIAGAVAAGIWNYLANSAVTWRERRR